tara:strand:- start:491 stop:757 length:267 start_codon:yes stop_codon:yes gene_type:complete
MTQYIQREIIMEYTQIDWDREVKYTAAEFAGIRRNADGDICEDLDVHCIWMTPAQKRSLTGDDQYRVDGYEEDMAYMMEEAKAEFAGA